MCSQGDGSPAAVRTPVGAGAAYVNNKLWYRSHFPRWCQKKPVKSRRGVKAGLESRFCKQKGLTRVSWFGTRYYVGFLPGLAYFDPAIPLRQEPITHYNIAPLFQNGAKIWI